MRVFRNLLCVCVCVCFYPVWFRRDVGIDCMNFRSLRIFFVDKCSRAIFTNFQVKLLSIAICV